MTETSPAYAWMQPPPHTTGDDVTLTYGPTVPPGDEGYEDTGDAQPPPHGTTDGGDRCAVCATLAVRVAVLEAERDRWVDIAIDTARKALHLLARLREARAVLKRSHAERAALTARVGALETEVARLHAALGTTEAPPDAECV